MDNPLVSVIIPVYKAERFLDECLCSVISQDYPALEIILVDDGSPDSCPGICDRYAEAYGHIRAIHQVNLGPGMARNAGLEAASGKYVAFVDSDDCLDGADAIRRLADRAEEKRADIVAGSFRRLDGDHASGVNRHRLRDGAYADTADFRLKGFVLYNHLSFAWGKLYRRVFLEDNGLRFGDYPFSEDKGFNMACCACRPAYAFVDGSVYLYRINGDSIGSRHQDGYASVWIRIASDFGRFLSERGIADEFGDLIAFHLCFGLLFLAKQDLARKGISGTAKALSEYGDNPLVRRTVKRLVRGEYIGQVKSKAWRAALWCTSLLCGFRAYGLLALGIWSLRKFKVDEKFVSSKYGP